MSDSTPESQGSAENVEGDQVVVNEASPTDPPEAPEAPEAPEPADPSGESEAGDSEGDD